MTRPTDQSNGPGSSSSGPQRQLRKVEGSERFRLPSLTETQRLAYKFLLQSKSPQSAYQILRELGRAGGGQNIYPQTVYRALERLQSCGLVHKLESTNTFLPCIAPNRPHESIHLLCEVCGSAKELVDTRVGNMLSRNAGRQCFRVHHKVIELRGICGTCSHGHTT